MWWTVGKTECWQEKVNVKYGGKARGERKILTVFGNTASVLDLRRFMKLWRENSKAKPRGANTLWGGPEGGGNHKGDFLVRL